MKTQMIAVVLASMVVSAIGETPRRHISAAEGMRIYNAMSPEKKAEGRRRAMMYNGGPIEKPGRGKVAVVNCQKAIPADVIAKKVDSLAQQLKIKVDLIEGKYETYVVPEPYPAAVYIIDDKNLPLTLYAIELGWGMMNVAYLEGSEKRFIRLFDRAVTMTYGGAVSVATTSPLQPLSSAKGLDKISVDALPFDCIRSILINLGQLGVTPARRSAYRQACVEGWAPLPTNDIQKAIWDEIHTIPTKPLKLPNEK